MNPTRPLTGRRLSRSRQRGPRACPPCRLAIGTMYRRAGTARMRTHPHPRESAARGDALPLLPLLLPLPRLSHSLTPSLSPPHTRPTYEGGYGERREGGRERRKGRCCVREGREVRGGAGADYAEPPLPASPKLGEPSASALIDRWVTATHVLQQVDVYWGRRRGEGWWVGGGAACGGLWRRCAPYTDRRDCTRE
jgi:hypothetical protein